MATPRAIRWRLTNSAELVWRVWDDQFVVYDAASGDTHLLSLAAREVLNVVQQSPADLGAIVRRLSLRLELSPEDQPGQDVENVLGALTRAGVIEAVQA
jgi:PqqD family protein of HPr-rel-A system